MFPSRTASAIFWAALIFHGPATAEDLTWRQAFRFLNHATFGPKRAEIARVQRDGYQAWLDEQFRLPASRYPEYLQDKPIEWSQDYFFQLGMQNDDQLRQRVAFALHKIFVVSAVEVNDGRAITSYLNLLSTLAFDNIYVVLKQITLHPAMGEYLDMVNNDRARPGSESQPNENYARELMQLFSIGLVQLNPDGTTKLDAAGNPIPTYTEADVKSVTRALTGWTYPRESGATRGHNPPFYSGFMTAVEANHDTSAKVLPGGAEIPAGQTAQQDLDAVIDFLYGHPNLAPFLSRQLIQQLVTSNPSPAYVARVSAVFEDNGEGVKGDLKAVIRAILLDSEAIDPTSDSGGHLKEPALAVLSLIRPIGARVGDFPVLADEAIEMGQSILFPPSVFSYFSPGYRIPGAGLGGPEFQILTSETALRRVNYVGKLLYGGFGSYIELDSKRYVDAAPDTNALLQLVDEDFLGGWMHDDPAGTAMLDAITKAVNAQESAAAKAAAAIYLVGSSQQFQVVR
ncbi:MAG: DUF1800 family protein [Bryobacteraceae bacterium]